VTERTPEWPVKANTQGEKSQIEAWTVPGKGVQRFVMKEELNG